MKKTDNFRIVFVTTNSFENAQHIAKILVSEKLIACCSIVQNVFSIFGWQGAIQERPEFLMILKTSEKALKKLEERVTELHPDEVPEIIAINISDASAPYLDWMKQTLID